MPNLETFRLETRAWLAQNCPESMRKRMVGGEEVGGGRKRMSSNPDAYLWLERMAEKGWTAPTWPERYGGGGLAKAEFLVLLEELQRIRARPPLGGMGITMIGPTLLEYGTEDQKQRHLPPIIRGDVAWCQGYSEPGAGSDLASLKTRAEDQGDHYLVNGSKIWTSGAAHADWMFCLVRTDPNLPKHQGISFVLFSMDSPGVSVKPILLLNGRSPFCQTFFDDVKVPKTDLVHKENQGWTVAKRLLQHERSGLSALASADSAGPLERIRPSVSLPELAAHYAGASSITDSALRDDIIRNEMLKKSF
ncbi:MAG: acyl-CoA dehydrogenase family protein, partial [Proteobacteria bacterium]|nr:acyl-CoA dehydrogenase family protein [Pseudomonadota bacterium]